MTNSEHRTFDDYLLDRLEDEHFRHEFAAEEAVARVAYRVFQTRTKRGMSQAELADRIGTAQPNISAIEHAASNPTIRTLGKLAQALEVDLGELLSGVDRYGVFRPRTDEMPSQQVTIESSFYFGSEGSLNTWEEAIAGAQWFQSFERVGSEPDSEREHGEPDLQLVA